MLRKKKLPVGALFILQKKLAERESAQQVRKSGDSNVTSITTMMSSFFLVYFGMPLLILDSFIFCYNQSKIT